MEEHTISRLWRVLFWVLRVGQIPLILLGLFLENLILVFVAFGSCIASMWLKRWKSQCPACGGALEGNVMGLGVKDAACRACGARIQIK